MFYNWLHFNFVSHVNSLSVGKSSEFDYAGIQCWRGSEALYVMSINFL